MTLTTDRRRHAQQVFEEALAKASGERAAFVARACREDAEVRAEVESLLAHDEQAGEGFMRVPEISPRVPLRSDPKGPDPRIGTTIGGYRVDGVIASGGMGTVYEAVQAEPHRTVALKVLHRHVASQSALRRFRLESQILAHLRHPNIAQVFAAGMHDEASVEVPYFAMEYIPEARTIVEYAAQKNLNTRKRLELFTRVCEAVHHGHQKGIIHRDLKPGNILVDASGRPKIIDFGVARSTDSDIAMTTMQTDAGQMIGTLQYMSPEQCDADPHEIDTRSDVYSLGVLLYELLTGRLPYDVSHMTIHSGARLICEASPARPSDFDRRLRGDVETIVLKSLEKDRQKRYQSAAELAGDIRRNLKGEPIDARPPTAWKRVLRWVTRHPVMTTATACVAIAALTFVATAVSVWYYKNRPFAIVLYRSGLVVNPDDTEIADEARLVTLGGNSLHSWGGHANAIVFSKLVDLPRKFGSGKLAVIGYSQEGTQDVRGSLCAYDVKGDRDTPVWSRRIETKNILPQLRRDRGFVGEQFTIHLGMFVDVFADRDYPGEELIVVFGNTHSQRIIRVYDLRGTLLYQAWHEGWVEQPYWMSGARLLVFVGDNAILNWNRHGRLLRAECNPWVVFALRPEIGHINETNFINDPESLSLPSGVAPESPVWYRCVYLGESPATHNDIGNMTLIAPLAPDAGHFVNFGFDTGTERGAGVGWTIDEFGEVIPGSLVLTDSYQVDQASANPKLPDPNLFHLGPMPRRAEQPSAVGYQPPAVSSKPRTVSRDLPASDP